MDSFVTTKKYNNICVVSCILGTKFAKVYPALSCCDCYFFTNNPALKPEIEGKGWIFEQVDMKLTDDFVISSNQAKWVKFLQFLKVPKYNDWNRYEIIIYIDHKINLLNQGVDKLVSMKTKSIIVKEHHFSNHTIWGELNAANHQQRYKVFETATRKYIQDKLAVGYTDKNPVCHTALMLYQVNNERVISFVNEMYNDLQLVGTPECQIIWCIVSQKYLDIIQVIKQNDVPVKWELP